MIARDQFVIEKVKAGFSAFEVTLLLEKNGFEPITVGRVYQILTEHGIKPPKGFKAEAEK